MKNNIIKQQNKIINYLVILFFLSQITFLGVISNAIVLKNNGNKMPVLSYKEFETDTHFSFQHPQQVQFYPLTDIFPIKSKVYSIGDLLMLSGGTMEIVCSSILIYQGVKLKKLKRDEERKT